MSQIKITLDAFGIYSLRCGEVKKQINEILKALKGVPIESQKIAKLKKIILNPYAFFKFQNIRELYEQIGYILNIKICFGQEEKLDMLDIVRKNAFLEMEKYYTDTAIKLEFFEYYNEIMWPVIAKSKSDIICFNLDFNEIISRDNSFEFIESFYEWLNFNIIGTIETAQVLENGVQIFIQT